MTWLRAAAAYSQVLSFAGNAIYLEGARVVAKLVTTTPTLRAVRLGGCRLMWSPEMVEFRARQRKKTGGKATGAAAPPPSSSSSGTSFDPAVRCGRGH